MVNWLKIICNSGVAFFTTIGGLLGADVVMDINLPANGIVVGALIVAGIQAGLAFFVSLQQQAEIEETSGTNCKKKGFTNYITLF